MCIHVQHSYKLFIKNYFLRTQVFSTYDNPMDWLGNFIRRFIPKRLENDAADAEGLRTDFRERYHQFKLLLNANNNALEIMARIEESLRGGTPFGMTAVRSYCTRISTSVFQIVKHLNQLAPGKYEALYERFNGIQEQLNPLIAPRRKVGDGPLVKPLEEIDRNSVDLVGSKMANLGEMSNRIHLDVPCGFAVTTAGYHRFMTHNELQQEIDRRIQATPVERIDHLYNLSATIQQLIIGAHLPEDLKNAISEQYRHLEGKEGKRVTLALRSSAIGEDYSTTSFAGQYRSELNVNPDNIFNSYKEIVASMYSLQAISYRLNRGIPDEDVAMCVGCLSMVEAVSGGVICTRNPVDIRDNRIIINSVWGLPKSVVDGSTDPDLYILSKDQPPEIREKTIRYKKRQFVCYPEEGICRLDLTGNKGHESSLSDDQAVNLSRLAFQLEGYYGMPQDIEWVINGDGHILILQCRPLQQIEESETYGKVGTEVSSESILLQGGTTASPGAAAGPVFVLKKDMDALRFPEGAVLVTAQSLPRWATLLNRASAVISEQGSVAGHLASVSREFRVPALFGLKGAMETLMDGQAVTVDADRMKVHRGRIEAILNQDRTMKNPMEGSPVLEVLKSVARHITPLNLLDPDAPAFRSKNCKTYHDITRFCHEKSVYEMFQFGKEHHFPERSSKQLVCDVPMQWWVLNLDDGFQEEVEDKYIQLENIVSIPMLALWEGITAFPWEGPPAIDGKGFMSVMFAATRNTALVPGIPSQYTNRNYFMISKNYCSLSSRLGFHLSLVEALISDRDGENYISFQFKGGAADDHRRQKRIVFVTDLLEDYGFRVEGKEDHLIARVESREKDFMKDCLRILGYLTIHTRQLDMIMSNDRHVNYYRQKMKKDIHDVLTRQSRSQICD